MWPLPPPAHDPHAVYKTCISKVKNKDLKLRLDAAAPLVVGAAGSYRAAARGKGLHTILTATMVGVVTGKEMEKVYKIRMAKKGAPGRTIYDELISAPAHGRCPLCGHRIVTTLDHHLPKTHYPVLSVVPENLVPSCSDCNKIKLAYAPSAAADVSLHPYFDNVDGSRWLFAEVVQKSPAALKFLVRPPSDWDATLAQRVQRHFRTQRLGSLYAVNAAAELTDIQFSLELIFASSGADGVAQELKTRATSCHKANRNSWRGAMFDATASSTWFCTGGFR